MMEDLPTGASPGRLSGGETDLLDSVKLKFSSESCHYSGSYFLTSLMFNNQLQNSM